MLRKMLLWASQNSWMKARIPKIFFVRRAVSRFMPGEELSDALNAAISFQARDIGTVFTYLGENITSLTEAERVAQHYLMILNETKKQNINADISIKLTQLGLDYSFGQTMENFLSIADFARLQENLVWIDMESSIYTDTTLEFFKQARKKLNNIGLCVQAYLYRTEADLKKIFQEATHIRLVKGAYKESANLAFPGKTQVDENYSKLAYLMLEKSAEKGGKAVFGTHDVSLIQRIKNFAETREIPRNSFEIHMLYGIRETDQFKLKEESYSLRVLISYGDAWYPWYMRRLAERPANLWFVLKNIFIR